MVRRDVGDVYVLLYIIVMWIKLSEFILTIEKCSKQTSDLHCYMAIYVCIYSWFVFKLIDKEYE